MQPPVVFDTKALALKRRRALGRDPAAFFLHQRAADQISERLTEVNKTFTKVGVISGFPALWQRYVPDSTAVEDSDTLAFGGQKFDLIIDALTLHVTNDPVGRLVQCRRALRPDGLLLAVSFGGQTLHELRAALAQAESELLGGLSPRVSPMAELRDLGDLLLRAGFALPVADSDTVVVTYPNPLALMDELRGMGETNVMVARAKSFTRRSLIMKAADIYIRHHAAGPDRINATFEMATLTGWAPSDDQPKPLRPGSATARLADALGTKEQNTF